MNTAETRTTASDHDSNWIKLVDVNAGSIAFNRVTSDWRITHPTSGRTEGNGLESYQAAIESASMGDFLYGLGGHLSETEVYDDQYRAEFHVRAWLGEDGQISNYNVTVRALASDNGRSGIVDGLRRVADRIEAEITEQVENNPHPEDIPF
jgi:hypothetical protein